MLRASWIAGGPDAGSCMCHQASQMMGNIPKLGGVWNPVVGAGAYCQVEGKTPKMEMEIIIVGKEDVAREAGLLDRDGDEPERRGPDVA